MQTPSLTTSEATNRPLRELRGVVERITSQNPENGYTVACGRDLLTAWLEPSFVLTELAVTPSAQQQGIGRRLHDTLLTALPQPTAVLTTPQVEMPANQLYLSAGWRVLRLDFQYAHMTRPYLVIGLDLRTRP